MAVHYDEGDNDDDAAIHPSMYSLQVVVKLVAQTQTTTDKRYYAIPTRLDSTRLILQQRSIRAQVYIALSDQTRLRRIAASHVRREEERAASIAAAAGMLV